MTLSDNYDAQHVSSDQHGATYNLFAMTGSRPDPVVTTICVDGKLLAKETLIPHCHYQRDIRCRYSCFYLALLFKVYY